MHQARKDRKVFKVCAERKVMLVRKDQLVQKELLERKAQSDQQDLRDQLDHKDQRVQQEVVVVEVLEHQGCLLYTSPSPRD